MAKHYTEKERAAALAALEINKGVVARTARELGIPRSTLNEWVSENRHHKKEAVEEEMPAARADLAERLDRIAHSILDFIPAALPEAQLKELTVALGIVVDKKQLLRGQPTQIHGEHLTDDERAARVAALFDRARERRAGGTPPN